MIMSNQTASPVARSNTQTLTDPTRKQLLDAAASRFDDGSFKAALAARIAFPTESEEAGQTPVLERYLCESIGPQLTSMGFCWDIHPPPATAHNLFLIGSRIEDPALATILIYGHGDVVRGQSASWYPGLNPWTLIEQDGRWFGRGTADNKGQHSIHLDALAEVIKQKKGRLGFNVKALFEMGEETGSPGLHDFAAQHHEALAADLLIASDGPRVRAETPTLFLGARGIVNVRLTAAFRDSGHHSGNWGGLLPNPATVLCNLIASWVDAKGRLRMDVFKPPRISAAVRAALANAPLEDSPGAPKVDEHWGEDGLTPAERVYAWNTLEVLAIEAGNASRPVNAIPGQASATVQLRYVVGTDIDAVISTMKSSVAALGYPELHLDVVARTPATRMEPDHPLVQWAAASLAASTGKAVTILPNLGGSLPNEVFAEILGMPTLWVPHSYPACKQHAPNEHLLPALAREGLMMMAGLYYDFAQIAPEVLAQRSGKTVT